MSLSDTNPTTAKCTITSSDETTTKRHRRPHTKNRPKITTIILCPVCHKSYRVLGQLNRHVESKHPYGAIYNPRGDVDTESDSWNWGDEVSANPLNLIDENSDEDITLQGIIKITRETVFIDWGDDI